MLFVGNRIIPADPERHRRHAVARAVRARRADGGARHRAGVGGLFGVSLALGAFVAGVVVSESPFSHQVSADLLPFREAFAVLFFVSVGMLVNPGYLIANWRQVRGAHRADRARQVDAGGAHRVRFPYPARTALVVAAGLSQIGEFSFIVGQAGLTLGVLDETQYSLILAGAIVSITLNPWMFRLIDPIERLLEAAAASLGAPEPSRARIARPAETLTGHVVIVGCGRVGRHIAEALGHIGVPRLVVESDASRTRRLQQLGIPVIFGDAANSEILDTPPWSGPAHWS